MGCGADYGLLSESDVSNVFAVLSGFNFNLLSTTQNSSKLQTFELKVETQPRFREIFETRLVLYGQYDYKV